MSTTGNILLVIVVIALLGLGAWYLTGQDRETIVLPPQENPGIVQPPEQGSLMP